MQQTAPTVPSSVEVESSYRSEVGYTPQSGICNAKVFSKTKYEAQKNVKERKNHTINSKQHDGKKDEKKKMFVKNVGKRNESTKGPRKGKMGPQSGNFRLPAILAQITQCFPETCSLQHEIANRIENIVALYVAVSESGNVRAAMASIFLYVKTHTSQSVCALVQQYAVQLLEGDMTPQARHSQKPDWLTLLKKAHTQWSLFATNIGFKKIAALLSMSVALGLCDATRLPICVRSLISFSNSARPTQISAFDFVDAVMSTVVHFVEGGYMCFKKGTFDPLLYGDLDNQSFREMYEQCMRCQEYYPSGNLRRLEGIDDNDYANLLMRCIEKGQQVIRNCTTTYEKSLIEKYCDNVRRWQATFQQTRVQGGLRVAPYTIGLYGGTSVGKSSVAQILMVTTLAANGFEADDDRLCSFNDDDKYNSNMRTDINGVFIDDMANTKPAYVEKAPTKTVIQVVNNAKAYANRAEVEMKGKVAIEPKVCVITKNIKDGGATIYSNEPASIVRRERITVTVTPRPAFTTDSMLDPKKVHTHYRDGIPDIPDIWDFHVEQSFPVTNGTKGMAATIGWKTVQRNVEQHGTDAPMQSVGIAELIRWIAVDSAAYFQQQNALMLSSNGLSNRLQFCTQCRTPLNGVCMCSELAEPEKMSVQSCNMSTGLLCWRAYCRVRRFAATLVGKDLDERTTSRSVLALERVATHWIVLSTNWISHECFLTQRCLDLVCALRRHSVSRSMEEVFSILHLLLFIFCFGCLWTPLALFAVFVVVLIYRECLILERGWIMEELSSRPDAITHILARIRERHVHYIQKTCAVVFALYSALVIGRKMRQMCGGRVREVMKCQGKLSPVHDSDIEQRDAEVNAWVKVPVSSFPSDVRARTTTCEQLENMVSESVCHVTIALGGNNFSITDAFFPCSNVALLPTHIFAGEENLAAQFVRNSAVGSTFRHIISRTHSYAIPGTDMTLAWIPSGGDWKDLRHYFVDTQVCNGPARLVYKDQDGELMWSKLYMHAGMQTTNCEFPGAKYTLDFPTFEGLCMAAVVAEARIPFIAGFHLGGKNGANRGCCGFLSKRQLDDAINALTRIPGVLLSTNTGNMRREIFGVQYYKGPKVHHKSPLNYMTEDPQVRMYGEVVGRSKVYSQVEETEISQTVSSEMNCPQKWGKPSFDTGYPWQAALDVAAHPAVGVEGEYLSWAVTDYTDGFINVLDGFPRLSTSVVPLSDEEVVNGKIATRFIDKMNSSTSIGYPLEGPKKNFQYSVPYPENAERQECVTFLPMIWDEVFKIEEAYVCGQRAYPIFKACLKDEPTLLTKDKVRVFQGAPVAFQILIRRYFLPVVRALSLLPIASECAVGINAHGPEWQELSQHMRKFGSERTLAGDYSKYDLRMPSQMTLAAFAVLIRIARHCGYSERDLIIMQGIATDVAYPTMAYNGDLVALFGSNPSGHNLTVYINCIVNSLLLRSAFAAIEDMSTPFRSMVALMTYGDDCKGSVSVACKDFNHMTVASYLSDRGMVFTMPDKHAEPRPFMKDSEADFLKRNSVYHKMLDCELGALQEDSIFKSLHTVLKTSHLSKRQQCMENIESALVEWFAHGEEVYERRREQLVRVALRHDLEHGCPGLLLSYIDRTFMWRMKYAKEPVE